MMCGSRSCLGGRCRSPRPLLGYLLRPFYMEYLYVEFVCKCIYVYFAYMLDGAGSLAHIR